MTVEPGAAPYQFRLLSDGLLGYAWPKWVRAGETSEFRVHSVEPYKLGLWRYGWHEGVRPQPRLVRRARPARHDADHARRRLHADRRRLEQVRLRQPAPQAVRRGPRAVGPVLLPCPRRPGERRSRSPGSWPRRGRRRRSPCWPRTSPGTPTTTSAAGATTSTPTGCRRRPTVNARLELKRYTDPDSVTYDTDDYAPLSFDRPEPINHIDAAEQVTDPIEGRAACHLAPAEWRLLGWLEREGFAYDYYAETQLHAGALDLDAYRVLILSTHPEYWTRAMYGASSAGSTSAAAG